jgi:hypothetical protein
MKSFLILIFIAIIIGLFVHFLMDYINGQPVCLSCKNTAHAKNIWDSIKTLEASQDTLQHDDDELS